MAKKRRIGRPKVGPAIHVVVTRKQYVWLFDRMPDGGTLSSAVRAALELAMAAQAAQQKTG